MNTTFAPLNFHVPFAQMKKFSCGEVVPGCSSTFKGDSEQHILMQVAAHAAKDHGMAEVSAEVIDAVRKKIRDENA